MKGSIFAVIAVFALALLLPAFNPPAEAQDPGRVVYQLIVDCPQARKDSAGTVIRCPIRAEDAADMMGSPSVAVDIRNPKRLVMASLHGGDADGPSVRSRTGLPYTTFTSSDAGRSWQDNFFPGPADVRGSYGEHPQIVTDPYGHVYIGSLWARPIGGSSFQYILSAQKFETLDKVNQNQVRSQGSYNVQYLDPFYKGSAINQYWYIFNPRTDNMTVLWHETPSPIVAPTSKPDDASFDGFQDKPSLRTKHSHAATPATVGTPPLWKHDPLTERFREAADSAPLSKFVIAYTWTNMTMKSRYHYALEENLIGPCVASTNPVWSEGWTYVGCVTNPDVGVFRWNEKTTPGRVELFRFQAESGLPPQYLGPSPISTGSPKLGVRSDGRLALFSIDVVDDKMRLLGAFGKYDDGKIDWSGVENYAAKLPTLRVDEKIVSANIQDLEFREYSGAVHMIIKEEVTYLQIPGVDGVTPPAGPRFRKTLYAIDERYGYLAHYNFDIGRLTNRTDPVLFSRAEENYNDLSDDIVQLPPGPYEYNGELLDDLYQREFFAVGDYGIVIFAEIIEKTDLRPPGVPPGPPGPPPVAAPALATTPSMVLLPMAGTTFAGLLAFALLANKRKNPLAAITKGE